MKTPTPATTAQTGSRAHSSSLGVASVGQRSSSFKWVSPSPKALTFSFIFKTKGHDLSCKQSNTLKSFPADAHNVDMHHGSGVERRSDACGDTRQSVVGYRLRHAPAHRRLLGDNLKIILRLHFKFFFFLTNNG